MLDAANDLSRVPLRSGPTLAPEVTSVSEGGVDNSSLDPQTYTTHRHERHPPLFQHHTSPTPHPHHHDPSPSISVTFLHQKPDIASAVCRPVSLGPRDNDSQRQRAAFRRFRRQRDPRGLDVQRHHQALRPARPHPTTCPDHAPADQQPSVQVSPSPECLQSSSGRPSNAYHLACLRWNVARAAGY